MCLWRGLPSISQLCRMPEECAPLPHLCALIPLPRDTQGPDLLSTCAQGQVCTAGSHSSPLHRPHLGGSHLCLSTQESCVCPQDPRELPWGSREQRKPHMVSPPVLPSLICLRSAWSTRCSQPLPPSPETMPPPSKSSLNRKLVWLFTSGEHGEGWWMLKLAAM